MNEHSAVIKTVRIASDTTKEGFVRINAHDFDHDEHKLFDKADKHLVPPRPIKAVAAETADVEDLRKKLGEALNRAAEAASERDEMKARAEAAEAKLGGEKPKAK
jgi:hypothetical protein